MNDQGSGAFDRRDYTGAAKRYSVACELARQIHDRTGEAACVFGSGLVLSREMHQEEALEHYRQALSIFQSIGDHDAAAKVLNSMGVLHYHRGEFQEAVLQYEQALHEAELAGSEVALAQTNTNLGNVYRDLGNVRGAVQCLQKALEFTRKNHMDQKSAWILNNLGSVYYQQNDFQLALSYHLQALALKEKQKDEDPADLASSTINAGLDYQSVGNFARAAASYDRALELLAAGNDPSRHALVLFNYGELLRRQGQAEAAIGKLTAAIEEAEKVPDPSIAANSRAVAGEIAFDRGRLDEALELGRRALEYGRRAGDVHVITQAGELVGATYHKLGRDEEAEAAFQESIRVNEELRAQLPGDQQSTAIFMNDRTSVYLRMAELEMGRNRPDAALAYVERSKARALFDVLASGRADISKSMTPEERNQEAALTRAIRRLNEGMLQESRRETPDSRRLTELSVQLEKARNQHRSFEIALYAAHPQLKVQRVAFEPASSSDLAAALPDSETALLEYTAMGDDATWLFVITRGEGGAAELKLYQLPLPKAALERDVLRFYEQVSTRDLGYRKLALSLYRDLLAPAAAQLRGKSTLVIVPDGALWKLPFQALQPSPDHYLVQDRAVFYVPSFSVLEQMRKIHEGRKPAPGRVLAVEAALLPSAEREVDGLRSVYGPDKVRVFRAADADEERIKREAPNYQVLHLAAHGVFENRNPMNSYLVLAKAGRPEAGVLEARAMMDLELHADMVILSGCETGRGEGLAGEGLIGMSWALFIAGSPTTVASQWKVESDSTSELMVNFHRNLSHAAKARALQKAALEVMKLPEYRHPFYWSGFVLMGEGW